MITPSTTINRREYWYTKNISSKTIGLGDLPAIPTFSPGATYDLLDFYDKETILQSTSLLHVMQAGWMQITTVIDDVTTVLDPSGFPGNLAETISTSTANNWTATQTFAPSTGPAIVAQGDVHAGDGTHHVDSQGVLRIFGMGSVNEDGSLPINYELLNIGWNGLSQYQITTEAGGTGLARSLSLNGVTIDPSGNLTATSFIGDGSLLTNLPIPSVGSPFSLTANSSSEVPLTITLAASQTANALSINSHGNTGGNLFSVDKAGQANLSGSLNLFGLGTPINGTLPTNYESLSMGWNSGNGNYEISGKAGGTGVVRAVSLPNGLSWNGTINNGDNPYVDRVGINLQSSKLVYDGVIGGNTVYSRNYGSSLQHTSYFGHQFVNLSPAGVNATFTLAASQTANALEINSVNGSGGDVFKVDASGNLTAGSGIRATTARFMNPDNDGVSPLIVTQAGGGANIRMVGGESTMQFWDDSTPANAIGIGMAIPGNAAGSDFVLSTYQSGGSWTERLRIENPTGGATFSGRITSGVVNAGTISSGTYVTDASAANEFRLTLGAPTALAAPTNAVDGQGIAWLITQDSTGHALTLASGTGGFTVSADDATEITNFTTANQMAYITAIYNSGLTSWVISGVKRFY